MITLSISPIYPWIGKKGTKGKRYNKYIKSKKNKKYDLELINILCDYFEDSKSNVIEYISFMNKKQLKEILKMYGKETL